MSVFNPGLDLNSLSPLVVTGDYVYTKSRNDGRHDYILNQDGSKMPLRRSGEVGMIRDHIFRRNEPYIHTFFQREIQKHLINAEDDIYLTFFMKTLCPAFQLRDYAVH